MALISSGSFVSANDKTLSSTFSFVTTGSLEQGNPSVLFVATDNIGSSITAWSAGGAMSVARYNLAGAGTSTAALAFGGVDAAACACTEAYNGTSWSAGGAMITARYQLAGTGTSTAALAFGGIGGLACTEAYNGSTWSAGGAMITARRLLAGAGASSNSALAFGGNSNVAVVSCTEAYNGSTWSTGGAMITARRQLAGAGTQNSSLAFGGKNVALCACTEAYNGSTWSTGGAMITARLSLAGAGASSNAALAFGGQSNVANVTCTEAYNGTSWSAGGAMSVARYGLAGAGTQTAALAFGGADGVTNFTCTEVFNLITFYTSSQITSIIDGFFNYNFGGTGSFFNNTVRTFATQSDGKILVGGDFTTYNNISQSYIARLDTTGNLDTSFSASLNGPVYKIVIQPNITGSVPLGGWSAGGAMSVARYSLAGAGTQNAALAFGGLNPPTIYTCTEAYNGSTWSTGGAMLVARYALAGAGTQNAALGFGGLSGSVAAACTEAYNGSTWSTGGAMITGRRLLAGAGTQNATLGFGGATPTIVACTEAYNGSTWSAGGAMITARRALAGAGTQNATLGFGGRTGTGPVACTEAYNGTSWTAGGAMSVARYNLAGAGASSNAALAYGGLNPSVGALTCTEAYNGTSWSAGGAMSVARYSLAGAGTSTAALAFGGVDAAACACTEIYTTTNFITSASCISDKIVAVGAFNVANNCIRSGSARFNPDSSLDGTYNIGIGSNNAVCTVLVQPTTQYIRNTINYTNKLILGGIFTSISGSTSSGSVRLNGDGTVDTTFNVGAGFSGSVDVRTIASTGSLLVFGGNFTFYSGSSSNRIAFVDSSSGNKISSVNIGTGFNSAVNSIVAQYDGKLLATGNFTQYSGSNINRLARINVAGTLDTAFSASIGTGLNNTGSVICIYPNALEAWSAKTAMITAKFSLAGAGTQNAALAFGGYGGLSCTEAYNGSTWSVGGAMSVARYGVAGAGAQNAALAFGGYVTPVIVSCTEAYNGSTWTAGGAMITARQALAGVGTQNAALAFGGYTPTVVRCTEAYNGLSWSAGGALITGRKFLAGAGTQNAALGFGGTGPVACTEAYNGTSWTAGGAIITARNGLAGAGTQTAALAFGGGASGPLCTCTEAYNGSSWSSRSAMITGRNVLAGTGTQTAALAFGGSSTATPIVACTEAFNTPQIIIGGTFTAYSGSTYSGSVRLNLSGALDNTPFNIGSGFSNTTTINDYLFYTPSFTSSVILAGGNFTTYSSSILYPYPNRIILLNSDGTVNGLKISSPISWNKVAEYTEATSGSISGSTIAMFYGSASSTIPSNVPFAAILSGSVTAKAVTGWAFRNTNNSRTLGTYVGIFTSSIDRDSSQTMDLSGSLPYYGNYILVRGIAFKGPGNCAFTSSPGFTQFTSTTSVWSAKTAMITARNTLAGAGTQNAALAFGGYVAVDLACTEAYNGSTWSTGGAMGIARGSGAGVGTQNAALGFGGYSGTAPTAVGLACTEAYNGSTWSVGGAMSVARYGVAGAGAQNAALAFGGSTIPVSVACTEAYNGTSWSAGGAMITARRCLAGVGTQNAALGFGGTSTTVCACTEVYNGTSWSAGGALITARSDLAGAGTQNAALGFGGLVLAICACTEAYNGSTWSAKGAMIRARRDLAGAGTQNAALAFGGSVPSTVACTEAYNYQIGTIGGISSSNISVAGEFLASSGSDLVGIGSSTKSQPQYSGSTSNSSIYYAIYEPFSRTSFGSSN